MRYRQGGGRGRFLPQILNDNKDSFPNFKTEFGCDFFSKASYPKVNVSDSDKAIIIQAAVPGLKKEDIDVKFDPEENTLSIAAGKVDNDEKEVTYIIRELKQSSFKRTFFINNPGNYDFTNIVAKMEDGIITIDIPKTEETKQQSINIDIN